MFHESELGCLEDHAINERTQEKNGDARDRRSYAKVCLFYPSKRSNKINMNHKITKLLTR